MMDMSSTLNITSEQQAATRRMCESVDGKTESSASCDDFARQQFCKNRKVIIQTVPRVTYDVRIISYDPIIESYYFSWYCGFYSLLFALVLRRASLHDLSVLAIRRTAQLNSRSTDIIMYYVFLAAKWRFVRVISLIRT